MPYKLYVWNGPDILQDYSPGIAITLAKTKNEAIENLMIEYDKTVYAFENKKFNKETSNFGTLLWYDDPRLRNDFLKALKKHKPIIRPVNKPFAIFQGGGS